MVDEELDGAAVGIEDYVSNHNGRLRVYGTIKMKPEDFVVREISAAGEVVGFSDKADELPTESELHAVLCKVESMQKEKKKRLRFEEPADGWRAALKRLIGLQSLEKVERVAQNQENECLLPSPKDFRDRVYLQNCIQNCFPGLDCQMQKPFPFDDQQCEQQILVVVDSVYKRFRDGGITLRNCDHLLSFLRKGSEDPAAKEGIELEHENSKEARTVLHRLIAKNSASFKTKTEMRDGTQRLVVYFSPKTNKKRKRSEPHVYLQFVLQKSNEEHFACFEKLARQLRLPLTAFTYAGIKDKTAITFQHVVVQGAAPDQLLSVINDESGSTGMRLGDFKYVETPMSLGGANGNKFLIVIRNLFSKDTSTKEMVRLSLEDALTNVKRQGFINYFGFQRVGMPTNKVRSHHIGEKFFAGQWEDALRLLMTVQKGDSDIVRRAKLYYLESGDIDSALKLLPPDLLVERQLLKGLKRYGDNAFEQAIQSISFARRVMYMHAYQSYVFNRMASIRLRRYGPKVVEGDLIQVSLQNNKVVKTVTAAEADTLNTTHENAISFVLLPLPGTNVVFPSNATTEAYNKMLEHDRTKNVLCKSGLLKGAYRSLIAYPRELEWSWQEEQGNTLSLQLSFSLNSGSFATMCLREILHTDI
ncbi:Uncharacterized conserved protein [Plasmopara halstedii]|uniref:Uncharacterized conserved protein n=1 Tax=Plasmopara halstedii TaxID=4781 RepID=A0A0N7L4P9_PLAHL|nr:Uncharacterized conserved protein [Plasmopara halstedii]CEG39283.1 Uncharacterized conserved protein [Plasmopara halstedii]|eukprot:XP_024575652.1 Uncharacterized conserved protein [Plasmopara halstedii]